MRKDGQPALPLKLIVPEVSESRGPFPVGCVQKYCERLQRLYAGIASWMQSALWPRSASVFSATKLRERPMTLTAFSAQLFAVVAFGPSSSPALEELSKASSYSLRRLGPTFAEACNLLWHERLPFGSWSAYGLAKAEAAMPFVYADSAVQGQAE